MTSYLFAINKPNIHFFLLYLLLLTIHPIQTSIQSQLFLCIALKTCPC